MVGFRVSAAYLSEQIKTAIQFNMPLYRAWVASLARFFALRLALQFFLALGCDLGGVSHTGVSCRAMRGSGAMVVDTNFGGKAFGVQWEAEGGG